MPRKPVDQVIEHRYSLSQYERDQLDTLITGLTFRNAAQPVVALLSDPVAIAAAVGIAEALGLIDVTGWIKENTWADEIMAGIAKGLYATYEEAIGTLEETKEQVNEIAEDYEKAKSIPGAIKFWIWANVENLKSGSLQELKNVL
jgi:hypothetical protein